MSVLMILSSFQKTHTYYGESDVFYDTNTVNNNITVTCGTLTPPATTLSPPAYLLGILILFTLSNGHYSYVTWRWHRPFSGIEFEYYNLYSEMI